MKKVAFVATVYRHLEAFHIPIIELLQKKGYEVHAYAHNDAAKVAMEKHTVICHDVPFERFPFSFRNVMALCKLLASFRSERFRIVHVHTPVGGALGRIAAKFAKANRVIYTAHGFHFYKGASLFNWLVYYPIERFLARWTDDLITMNKEDFERAQKFRVRGKVHYLPGVGVNIGNYDIGQSTTVRNEMRHALRISETDFVVLCIAEFIPRKNHLQLIKAINEIKLMNNSIKCLFAGVGNSETAIKSKVTEMSLNENVRFLGFRSDIPSLLASADVVALTSKHEGLPRALMESMAAGKPIMATDVRGNRDLIRHGINGLLVPLHDIQCTTEAITSLMVDPELRYKLARNSRNSINAYSLEGIVGKMTDIYCGITPKRERNVNTVGLS